MSRDDTRAGDHVRGGTVTFLFTDLVGSTQLIESLGDDVSDPLIRTHLRRLRAVVSRHDGHVVKSLGDGLMAAFSGAAQAIDAAVHMQQVVAASRDEEGPKLELRVGINAGEAVYDGIDYYGKPVWVAQRYCDAAKGGQILTSEVVRALVGSRGSHRFDDRGTVALRGVAEPAQALEVAWEPDPHVDLASLDASNGRRRDRTAFRVVLGVAAVVVTAAAAFAWTLDRNGTGEGPPRSTPTDPDRTADPFERVRLHAASVHRDNRLGESRAGEPSVANGGSLVAFATASELTRIDNNDVADVYLHTGRGEEPILVSSAGGQPGNAASIKPDISADGSRVVFLSRATNLVPGVTDGLTHVYLYDVDTGSLRVVSRRNNGSLAVAASSDPVISAGGESIAFASQARNLAVAGDANGFVDVFRHEVNAAITNRVSVPAQRGVEPDGPSGQPAISPDGIVGFSSRATNLAAGDTTTPDVFFYSLEGEPVKVSSAGTGQADGPSGSPSLARGGRAVAFTSEATDLVPGDTNDAADVFVWTAEGVERISLAGDGDEADGASYAPSISGNGRYVAFLSDASNLVDDDTNGVTDAFIHDRREGTTVRVSLTTEGDEIGAETSAIAIAPDGRSFAFVAPASAVDAKYPSSEVPTVFVGVR